MRCLRIWVFALVSVCALRAAEYKGQVKFGGLPVPGATVTAVQGEHRVVSITDPNGNYVFPDLPDGIWNIQVEMLCFATIKQDVTLAAGAPAGDWELKLLPLDEIKLAAGPAPPPSISYRPPETGQPTVQKPGKKNNKKQDTAAAQANPQGGFQRANVNANAAAAPAAPTSAAAEAVPANSAFANQSASELNQRATDGLLINGTVNNGAASPFAQAAAFGNNRRGAASLYNGTLGLTLDNSNFDARAYSLTGQNTPKPDYNHIQGAASFGGPLRIPHVIRNGPQFFVAYAWTRNHNASTQPALVPTAAQRAGDFSLVPPVIDPLNGAPFPGNSIPDSRITSQARALLSYYPLPDFSGSSRYNFQVPLLGVTHQDSLQSRLNKNIGNKNQLFGTFAFQRTATDTPTLFGFLDKSNILGMTTAANWTHRFNQRMFVHFQYQFSRQTTRSTPNFANRENVSGVAGISGNNQDPVNWGPPTLQFSSGIAMLTDAQAASNRNETNAYGVDALWNHGRHNWTYGADFRRQEFNNLSQEDPRGTFKFTGAATGNDFAGFLLGIPDTSQIAYGNADKYFRASLWDAFVADDWRIGPSLTVNLGVRWEYGSPITELYGRLVNLDIAPGYSAIVPVVAANPTGSLTGRKFPDSLIEPDKHAFQPRIGLAWRPLPASSLIVRAGYGVYYNTSVYTSIAIQMSQQSPLSRSLSVQNTAANPLTLENGFIAPPNTASNTFAIDPNFRVGYAHNWNISVQRDLPGSLVMSATYLGIKGTRGPQEFLPNTYPAGAVNPCPACPAGYAFITSNGNSTRESGQLQLRRRLHNGFTATAQYTYSKSIDDSAVGGRGATNVIAQDWLNLSAERGLSNFDQRHALTFQAQYTSGMGIGGGTLLSGWRGTLLKEWTITSNINASTGTPLTPTVFAAVRGTGVTGPIRPEYTGASVYDAPPGFFLNPAAYALPPSGQWGNAGRNSITGPSQFALNAGLGRTFRLKDRYSLDLRVDATNAINHVNFPSWITTVNSAQFGLPNPPATNSMRSLQTTLRVRF
jgi:trimeric autotransporter adhesin